MPSLLKPLPNATDLISLKLRTQMQCIRAVLERQTCEFQLMPRTSMLHPDLLNSPLQLTHLLRHYFFDPVRHAASSLTRAQRDGLRMRAVNNLSK